MPNFHMAEFWTDKPYIVFVKFFLFFVCLFLPLIVVGI